MPPQNTIAIVIPCYNEEAMLDFTIPTMLTLLKELKEKGKINEKSKIILVDDGSKDKTWEMLRKYHANNPHEVMAIKLANNFGHQSAILAGMFAAEPFFEGIITIDADLQDDTSVIEKMIDAYNEGNEIVYGVRDERKTDTFFKKVTALSFYKLMRILGVNIVYNHADYRFVSRRVIRELKNYTEVNLFLRGIFPLMGFTHTFVYYDRNERIAGESKYPFRKMLNFAIDGITSFSIIPLRWVTYIGFFIFIISLSLMLYAFISYFTGNVVKGWFSTVIPIYFIGGIQLLSLGIIGEYLGKIYKETKERPRYIIENILD